MEMVVVVKLPFDSVLVVVDVVGRAVRARHFALGLVDTDAVDRRHLAAEADVGIVAADVDVEVAAPNFAAVVDVPFDLLIEKKHNWHFSHFLSIAARQ